MLFASLPSLVRENLYEKARGRKVCFPEGEDERVIAAARILEKELSVKCMLGNPSQAQKQAELTRLVMEETAAKKGKTLPTESEKWVVDPVFFAGAQLVSGEVDAVVGGCTCPTAHVIRAALATVGLRQDARVITSAFLFRLPIPTPGGEEVILYSDCAVIPSPDAKSLADIAFLAQSAFTKWTDATARVAFLSFSTLGSAKHPDVEKVRTAFEIFSSSHPNIAAEGEIQFDTAVVPEIAQRKNPAGAVLGRANVFIFPDLDAGNIGYKMTQRLGQAEAWGPVLLGTALPFSDLSRGASPSEIAHSTLLTLALN